MTPSIHDNYKYQPWATRFSNSSSRPKSSNIKQIEKNKMKVSKAVCLCCWLGYFDFVRTLIKMFQTCVNVQLFKCSMFTSRIFQRVNQCAILQIQWTGLLFSCILRKKPNWWLVKAIVKCGTHPSPRAENIALHKQFSITLFLYVSKNVFLTHVSKSMKGCPPDYSWNLS